MQSQYYYAILNVLHKNILPYPQIYAPQKWPFFKRTWHLKTFVISKLFTVTSLFYYIFISDTDPLITIQKFIAIRIFWNFSQNDRTSLTTHIARFIITTKLVEETPTYSVRGAQWPHCISSQPHVYFYWQ